MRVLISRLLLLIACAGLISAPAVSATPMKSAMTSEHCSQAGSDHGKMSKHVDPSQGKQCCATALPALLAPMEPYQLVELVSVAPAFCLRIAIRWATGADPPPPRLG